jgi:asparagine synthetase B (glutamine-hydrolysing)
VADSTARLDDLVSQSVKEHLAADVPVGVWLSGGLDSSTVLHYASQHSATPLKTFSITFNGREFDEAPYLRKMADRDRNQAPKSLLGRGERKSLQTDRVIRNSYRDKCRARSGGCGGERSGIAYPRRRDP